MKGKALWFICLMALFFLSCGPKVSPATQKPDMREEKVSVEVPTNLPDWQVEWNRTLERARKEGRVSVYNTAGSRVREALISKFEEKTGITLDLTTVTGAQGSAKIIAEHNAGLFLLDVYTGGTGTIFSSLEPAGLLAPIGPALILPEVLDKKAWLGGDLNYIDDARKFVLAFTGNPGGFPLYVNRNVVKKDEITSFYDLLALKWKGKIIMLDPTKAGKAANWFHIVLANKALNQDYMRALAKQEPMITSNERLIMDWLIKEKMPLGMHVSSENVKIYLEAGVTVIEGIKLKEDVPDIGASRGGSVVLMKRAPHPNAAKVFMNWLLSREGQYIYSEAGIVQSRRLDVPTDHLPPEQIRDPKVNYFNSQTEQFRREETQYLEIAKEIFGPLIQ